MNESNDHPREDRENGSSTRQDSGKDNAVTIKTESHSPSAERSRDRDRQRDRDRRSRGNRSRERDRRGVVYKPRARPECRVYVSNIPFEYRWQELKDLFRKEVGEVSFVELFEDERGKARGCGIVEFQKEEDARLALDKMHRFTVLGRSLVVKKDYDMERDEFGRLLRDRPREHSRERDDYRRRDYRSPPRSEYRSMGRGSSDYRSGGGAGTLASPSLTQWSNTYGLSPQFLESLGIEGNLISRLFVANLAYKVDDDKLREVFQLAGKVVKAEVCKDNEGKSRGFAVVEMDHPLEAVQAISMFNNQMLYDRKMTVRMDRKTDTLDSKGPKLPEGLRGIGLGLGAGGNPLQDVARAATLTPSAPSLPPSMSGLSGTPDLGMSGGYSSVAGVAGLGGVGGHGGSTLSSLSSHPASDLSRGLGSSSGGYSLSSGLSSSLGTSASLGSSSYGYSSEPLPMRGSLSQSQDYDRRDTYDPYRGSQSDYRQTTVAYEHLGNRMGSSVGPVGGSRLSDTIVISNLPPSYQWQDLRDKLCDMGDVLFAEMRGKGTGIVRFNSERDARAAYSELNGARLDGYVLEVDYYHH